MDDERQKLRPDTVSYEEFEQWWSELEPQIFRTATRLSVFRDQAEDLVHDIAVLALRDLSRFPSREDFARWAFKRLRWLAIDAYRAREKREPWTESMDLWHPSPPDQENVLLLQPISEAIRQLPDRQKKVIVQTAQGRTTGEIAEDLGVTEATVRSLRRFARNRLARLVGTFLEAGSARGGE